MKNETKSFLVLLAVGFVGLAFAQQNTLPEDVKEVGINEKLGQQIPFELLFTNTSGEPKTLGTYFKDRPIVLSLVYFECPMMCHFILDGMWKVFNQMTLNMGEDYDSLTVSFDPKDTPERARKWALKYRNMLQRPHSKPEAWRFLTGDQENITSLAEAVGFQYKYLEEADEYSHSAALFVLSPNGKITRYLYGIDYKPIDLKLAFIEAKDERQKSSIDKLLLFCYKYNPEERSYVLHATNAMKLAGLLSVMALVGFIVLMLTKESQRKNTDEKGLQL